MVQVVNVVASGALGVEFDLEAVARELDDIVDYDPEKYPGAYSPFCACDSQKPERGRDTDVIPMTSRIRVSRLRSPSGR